MSSPPSPACPRRSSARPIPPRCCARRCSAPGEGRVTARLLVEGTGLAFEVEDNGIGLPARDRDRLTEPYVTTREKGTGLGLAIVKRIAEDHSGELTLADMADGPGARVTLHFPNVRRAEAPAARELIEETHGG